MGNLELAMDPEFSDDLTFYSSSRPRLHSEKVTAARTASSSRANPTCFNCLRELSSDNSPRFCWYCKLPGHPRPCSEKVTAVCTACSSRADPVSATFPSP